MKLEKLPSEHPLNFHKRPLLYSFCIVDRIKKGITP